MTTKLGVVAIGRNEGPRLKRCLDSLLTQSSLLEICYVDSGSTDGSVEYARGLGVMVVELDMSKPFTMSRARNHGWQRLLESNPDLKRIQFVDGDCEVVPGWFEHAEAHLSQQPSCGIVSGRRRERFPNRTIYNRIADMEWDTPCGVVRAVLGDMLVRSDALIQTGGFDESVIAAEDDEFCIRVRELGMQIVRLDVEMSIHDMAMTRFSQWWRRSIRSGHGFAQVNLMHGKPPEHYFSREVWRTVTWGCIGPLLSLALAAFTSGLSLVVLLLLYGVQWGRTYLRRRKTSNTGDSALYASFAVLSKFPGCLGVLEFYKRQLLRRPSTLIEYKNSPPAKNDAAGSQPLPDRHISQQIPTRKFGR